MKIVYYLPSLEAPGGLERIVTFKANYFAEHFDGYEVTILTSEQRGEPPHFPLSERVKHIDLDVPFDVPYTQSRLGKLLKYPFRYYRFKQRFTRALNDLRPDITISTLRRELNFINTLKDGSVKIGEFHVTRYAYGAEAVDSNNPLAKWIKKRWSDIFVRNLARLTRIVILTHEGAKDWPELHNISVIPNPISTPQKAEYADGTSRKAIAVGRYAPQKGFDLLIPAWKIVSQQHPDWTLSIYGEGALYTSLQAQIDSLQLTDSCLLEHTVSNITDKYCESSIFVLSSRFEGFGMVIIEAMGCGVPPVSFACPCGPRDIIDHGRNGILVENGDIPELAAQICYLIEHEDIRKEMGRCARMDVERFKIESIAQQWKELFESVIDKQ